jgi:hypothetical protein
VFWFSPTKTLASSTKWSSGVKYTGENPLREQKRIDSGQELTATNTGGWGS